MAREETHCTGACAHHLLLIIWLSHSQVERSCLSSGIHPDTAAAVLLCHLCMMFCSEMRSSSLAAAHASRALQSGMMPELDRIYALPVVRDTAFASMCTMQLQSYLWKMQI